MAVTYRDAGVDIDEGNRFVRNIKKMVESTKTPGVLSGLGGFGALFQLDIQKYKNPVLVSGTDGVGTKLKVAFMADRHNTVGIDLVAMCVNDILTCGAQPLFFLDYLAAGKLVVDKMAQVVEGIAKGCTLSGAALIGGETAELPGFYKTDEYDLAGFSVGVVDKENIIDGKNVSDGDCLIALPSSGLHSNGYSLARKVFFDIAGKNINDEFLGTTVGEVLLTPTNIYVKSVLQLMNSVKVNAMSHITGGGVQENLIRSIPEEFGCVLEKSSWEIPELFEYIESEGKIEQNEMFRAFNMGIGFIIVIDKNHADLALDLLKDENPFILGHVKKGEHNVTFI